MNSGPPGYQPDAITSLSHGPIYIMEILTTYLRFSFIYVVMKLLVTGVPGTGKTTISKKLAEILNLTHINVGHYAKNHFDFPIEEGEIVVDEILMEEELEKLENIIIDSHIPFKADKAIILRCSPTVLFDRLSKRNYNMEKIKDNLLSEILDYVVCEAKDIFDEKDIYEVLSENMDDAIKEILEIVKGKGISLKTEIIIIFLLNNILLIEK